MTRARRRRKQIFEEPRRGAVYHGNYVIAILSTSYSHDFLPYRRTICCRRRYRLVGIWQILCGKRARRSGGR
ncbi:hypothetical protein KCP69_26170 [Salmonella enterica subsp. enterica]|nr:hypothetical protein KCP69_26170 [Salmonella enterica subsp. enterica]